ncbi:unnamed protein product [Prorocentrum cordatum]|uniref:Mitogen-activated protein kinase n=1 Tax=Prorocentrum cordatum TaxID=2364126 RepID=A0ABN9PTC6_9DINO|nr:unnamed protein product [Polarella glacialis]
MPAPPSPAAAAQLAPPHRSGSWQGIPVRYQIEAVIGQGAYGTVCEAYDREREEAIAVKQVRRLFDNLPSCKRTLREIAILTALNHDCVMKVHDIFVPRDEVDTFSELYIVMELCDTDLQKLVALDMVLTTEHIAWLMYNLMRGLAYLHSVGVCHRDLKPANCLVNQHCTVKITDFNLSCIMGCDGAESGPPRPPSPIDSSRPERRSSKPQKVLTSHVVTRHYRAPEVILLERSYTTKIDIWSAACIFAELLQTLPEGPPCARRGPLFPGTCSYPLSPGHASQRTGARTGRDQLSLIFDLLGTPSQCEVDRLDRADARRYVQCFQARAGQGVRGRVPYAGEAALRLLGRLLAFSPEDRATARQALRSDFFAGVRQEEEAAEEEEALDAAEPVRLHFEEEGSNVRLDDEDGLRGCILEVMRALRASAAGAPPAPPAAACAARGGAREEPPRPAKGEPASPAAPLMAAAHEAGAAAAAQGPLA